MSVNVSNLFFYGASLTNAVARGLGETQLDPESLELELTESITMRHVETSITMLLERRAMGVQMSIDDFGTDYSSLSHLQRFPLNMLKIDQPFIQDVTSSSVNASITRTIISLAHSMNLSVLAEGVETDEQLTLLRGRGVMESRDITLDDQCRQKNLRSCFQPLSPRPCFG